MDRWRLLRSHATAVRIFGSAAKAGDMLALA